MGSSSSSQTVDLKAGSVTNRHMQCRCADTCWPFYAITPKQVAVPHVKPSEDGTTFPHLQQWGIAWPQELVLGSGYLLGALLWQIHLWLLSWWLKQFVPADLVEMEVLEEQCSAAPVLSAPLLPRAAGLS